MAEIDREGFARQQMHGYRVAGEGVDREHIEPLAGLVFKRQASIAQ